MQQPYKHAKAILFGASVVGIGATFLPKLSFDFNPLNLYDPRSEAVLTIKELFKNDTTPPWTISVLVQNGREAKVLSTRLRGLNEVKEAITIADFVPEDQARKLAILSDITLFMPPRMEVLKPGKLSYEKKIASLESLEASLNKIVSAPRKVGDKSTPQSAVSTVRWESLRRLSIDPKMVSVPLSVLSRVSLRTCLPCFTTSKRLFGLILSKNPICRLTCVPGT